MGVFWSFLLHQSFGCVFPLCHTSFVSLPKTQWFMFCLYAMFCPFFVRFFAYIALGMWIYVPTTDRVTWMVILSHISYVLFCTLCCVLTECKSNHSDQYWWSLLAHASPLCPLKDVERFEKNMVTHSPDTNPASGISYTPEVTCNIIIYSHLRFGNVFFSVLFISSFWFLHVFID